MNTVQKKWVAGIGGGILAFWLLLQAGAMFFHVGDGIFRPLSFFVLPPAWVGFSPISYHRVVETAHAFVALNIAPTYQDAFPLACAFVVRDVRIRTLLPGESFSQEEIFTDADRATLEAADISSGEQGRYIEEPLRRARGADVLRNEMLPSQSLRLQNILEKIDLDMPFADIARYFSEDSSAMNGGDLGIFSLAQLPAWARGVADMQVGEVRSDFVGADAFWVLKVVDAGGVGEDAWVQIRGIAINKPTLGAVLRAHAAEHPVFVFVW